MALSAVDPGFPRGGGRQPESGAPTYSFARIRQKLHQNEVNWTEKGARNLAHLESTYY